MKAVCSLLMHVHTDLVSYKHSHHMYLLLCINHFPCSSVQLLSLSIPTSSTYAEYTYHICVLNLWAKFLNQAQAGWRVLGF